MTLSTYKLHSITNKYRSTTLSSVVIPSYKYIIHNNIHISKLKFYFLHNRNLNNKKKNNNNNNNNNNNKNNRKRSYTINKLSRCYKESNKGGYGPNPNYSEPNSEEEF